VAVKIFKEGDKVVLITTEKSNQESQNWAIDDALIKGKIYIVKALDRNGWVRLEDTPCGYYHPWDKFNIHRIIKDPRPDWF
jgi:hypothetical protein